MSGYLEFHTRSCIVVTIAGNLFSYLFIQNDGGVKENKIIIISVRSTTSLGTLVMGFNETKYVSKKRLQFESTLYENALCQNSALDLSGLTHSDSFFCFPIVLL